MTPSHSSSKHAGHALRTDAMNHSAGRSRWARTAIIRVPTGQGWLALGVSAVAVLASLVLGIHPFLAVTEPVEEGFLLVEGWLHDDAVPDVLRRFGNGKYRCILTTGGELSRGSLLADFGNFAELSAATLVQAGVSPGKIRAIPALPSVRNRTYSSAVAVAKWLAASGVSTRSLDVMSTGAHARRSRLLYEMALGQGVDVGVISIPPTAYDQDTWWRTSSGVRTVIGELTAYIYAKLLFWP